jgi:hypothetical protein
MTTLDAAGTAAGERSLLRNAGTVVARTTATCGMPSRARKRFETRALAATDATTCLLAS